MDTKELTKMQALAKHLDCDIEELSESSCDDAVFEHGRAEYLVLTDQEADMKTREHILDSLWAFRPEFLQSHYKDGVDAEAIRPIQEKLCESANPTITALVKDLNHLVDDAISADGRGHFLAHYDGEESEEGQFYIYRIN